MNILVCVKQVPEVVDAKINQETGVLLRAGVPGIVSTFDANALELAVRLKEQHGGKVTVISMGPEKAKGALKECLAVGADQAYIISDEALSGSDTLATAYVLSAAIKKIEAESGKFDLIFCGRQSVDWDNGQVGPQLAESLGCALVTCASEVEIADSRARVKRENDDAVEIIGVALPAVITVNKLSYEPRLPSIKSKLAANKAAVPGFTTADLSIDAQRIGVQGSVTKVVRTEIPSRNKTCLMIKEDTNELSAQKLLSLMAEAKLI